MVKTPSFDSLIEKARAHVERVHALSVQLAAGLGTVPEVSSDGVYQAENAHMEQLRIVMGAFEDELLALVHDVSARADRAYAAFDAVDAVSGYQALVAFFRRKEAPSFKVVRSRKLAIAESSSAVLMDAAAIHGLVHVEKDRVFPLVQSCEPQILSSMERRRNVASAMDDARQRDRELAALIGTLRGKINNVSDEVRLHALKAEEAEADTRRAAVLIERKRLADEYQVLDRQAVLLADLIDCLNDLLVLFTLAINKISIEAERCIQLYDAVYGTLEPLLANTRLPSSREDNGEEAAPLGAFRPLLLLHTQGKVTMQDIEKRKARADHALSLRSSGAAKAGAH